MLAVVVFILLVYLYSLLSRRLEGTILTIPLVFAVAGIVLVLLAPALVRRDLKGKVWLILAEITYAIVLFNGATRVNLRVLRGQIADARTAVGHRLAADHPARDVGCDSDPTRAVPLGGGRPGLPSGLHRHRPGRTHRSQPAGACLHSRGAQRRVGPQRRAGRSRPRCSLSV